MVSFNSRWSGGRLRFCRMAILALGLTTAMAIGVSALNYVDDFSVQPSGLVTPNATFTTGTSATGLAYSGSAADLFAWMSGLIDVDSMMIPGSFAITSRDGKAFVFNSLEWDDDAAGATITGTGPEPFTISIASGGTAQTRSPSGGSKLVTSVTVSSSDMWSLMDDVSVELDVPAAGVYGESQLIINGDSSPRETDGTDFGATPAGMPVTQDFVLKNLGDAALFVNSSVTVSGTGFSITQQPSSPIGSGGSSTFIVQFNPTATGVVTGTVTIDNNSEADDYTFSVTGEGDADITKPDVTINQAGGQADPTNGSPINFTVVFSETVTGFATGDVTLAGTAGATTGAVTGSGTTYNVAVSGMTGDGTVTATIAAGVAQDGSSNTNNASTSTDNTVTYDATDPTDPTPTSSSHSVSVWDNDNTVDIQISGASDGAGSGVDGFEVEWDQSASWTPSETKEQEETWPGATYTATSNGDWYFHIATVDNAGNWTSTQHLGPFRIDTTPPSVPTDLDPASGSYAADTSPILSWTASTDTGGSGIRTTDAYRIVVTGPVNRDTYVSDTDYNPTLSEGTFTWKVYARDNAGNSSSYTSDTTLIIDATQPDVTIDQSGGQADPTTASPVVFTAVFDEPINDATFTDADVTIGGTATTGAVTVTE
ncbi:MAG: choice-of-anchor D domain-containing protein, partial [Candidatus Atribacteria bacterium]